MKRFILTLIGIAAGCLPLRSATLRTMHITNADGLSNSSVTCILQDTYHSVWIGTWDGLNIFNYHNIRTYKHDPSDENSLSNNIIREIVEQHPGVIWVATDNGANRLDLDSGEISRFQFGYDSSNPLTEHSFKLACTSDGILFCSVGRYGLTWYDEKKERFEDIGLPGVNMYDLKGLEAYGNTLWLLDSAGCLYKSDVRRDADGRVFLSNTSPVCETFSFKSIYDISSDYLPLAGPGDCLSLLDPETGEPVKTIRLPGGGSSRGDISAIAIKDSTATLSFAGGKVYALSLGNGRFSPFGPLDDKAVISLFYGDQNTLWAGTDGQGVIVRYPSHRIFGVVRNDELPESRNTPVRCFCTAPDGTLWVGTKGDGIHCFDKTFRLVKGKFPLTTAGGLSNNSVYCMIPGPGDDMLVGTDGSGIDVCSSDGRHIRPLDISLMDKDGNGFKSVYSLYLDRDRMTLWAGTSGFGLIRMDIGTGPDGYFVSGYERYLNDSDDGSSISNNTIYSILPDGDALWIGTRGGGLNRLDPKTGTFTHFTAYSRQTGTLSSNDVLVLSRDAEGTLWVGTGYGLNRMEKDGSFTSFTEREGLPNNTIHGILPDSRGVLWLSTNKGICRFVADEGHPVNYSTNDELQSNEFSDGAYYSTPDGFFLFGGIGGFNHFVPEQIHQRNFSPEIGITDFRVFNKTLPNYNNSYFHHTDNSVTLRHDQHFFSISFVAYDIIDNANCEYAYKLEGFDRDWVMASGNNTAVFTNVPPGRYVFRVRSTNSDKIWCDNELAFPIRVSYPWWARWWAYILYSLAATLVLLIVWKAARNQIRLNRTLLLERLSQQREQDIHEAKLRFFTNIAHEFCTPLTLIYGPCEKMLERPDLDGDSARYLRIIRSNAERMQRLISELMDFRKAETGHRVLNYETIDLGELAGCIADNFEELRSENHIDFALNVMPEGLCISSDRDCLEKIVFNLVSNACKYTPAGGTISLDISLEGEDGILLSVSNTGKGIRPEDLDGVFDNFKILDNFEKQASRGILTRTGIGLALTKSLVSLLGGKIEVSSELGGMTVFTVHIPSQSIPNRTEEKSVKPASNPTLSGSGTILIVDDEPQIRDLVEDIFSSSYNVLKASDGRSAIRIMQQCRPDLIISDILMPGMNGEDLVRELKANPFTASIPVVFLTSKVTTSDHISGYELGVDAYIPKPFHPKHLEAVVNNLVTSRHSLQEFYNSPLSKSELYKGSYINGSDKSFLLRLNSAIEDNLEDDSADINRIANILSTSRIQLYRKIHELTGLTPSEYIRTIKLDHAGHLLRTTELTVQEIMYRSGFNNKSYFYREFSRKYNCSPKEYRGEGSTNNKSR